MRWNWFNMAAHLARRERKGVKSQRSGLDEKANRGFAEDLKLL